jgi:hypothetical protein
VTGWLIDTSALARLDGSPDAETWADRVDRALVRIAVVTRLEMGYSARSGPDPAPCPLASMPLEDQTPAIAHCAIEVQTLLADAGRHRAPSVPGLIVAATAELAGLVVLHLDRDFDLIGEITGQPTEKLNVNP